MFQYPRGKQKFLCRLPRQTQGFMIPGLLRFSVHKQDASVADQGKFRFTQRNSSILFFCPRCQRHKADLSADLLQKRQRIFAHKRNFPALINFYTAFLFADIPFIGINQRVI